MGFGKDGKGQIGYDKAIANLGTLAAATPLLVNGGPAIEDDFRMTRMELFVTWLGATDEDHILIALADGELSIAEITDIITASPVDSNDHANNEVSHRPFWPICMLHADSSGQGGRQWQGVVQPKWTFKNADSWQLVAFNMGSGALTTGSSVSTFYKYFGVWVN